MSISNQMRTSSKRAVEVLRRRDSDGKHALSEHHSSQMFMDVLLVQELASRGIRRRNELPQRMAMAPGSPRGGGRGKGNEGAGFVDCQDFVRRGACRVFNERGHCSNHHPLDAHVVEIPRPRCPQVRGREYLPYSSISHCL